MRVRFPSPAPTMMICELCLPTKHILLWQNSFCRVVLLNDDDYPAYCRVELLAHVKEMTDLIPTERVHIMQVVFAVELAIRAIFNPAKINLASLGNKTPHVHWHVIPRFESDKHFPNSHWGKAVREVDITKLDEKTTEILKKAIISQINLALNMP